MAEPEPHRRSRTSMTSPEIARTGACMVFALVTAALLPACNAMALAIQPGHATESEECDAAEAACQQHDAFGCDRVGRCYADRQQTARAIDAYTMACNEYRPSGCRALAALYAKGDGVPADPQRARSLLERSCSLGGFAYCQQLGEMFAAGSAEYGITPDPAKSRAAYRRVCFLEVAHCRRFAVGTP